MKVDGSSVARQLILSLAVEVAVGECLFTGSLERFDGFTQGIRMSGRDTFEAVEAQHGRGRLTIRERIDRIADAESFREQGPIAGYGETDEQGRLTSFQPANYVLGVARVEGRPVVVGGEDFTQRGGSPSPAGLRKSVYAETIALRYRLPLVRLLEGGGGSVTGSGGKNAPRPMGDAAFGTPRFRSIMQVMATAPVVSAALGAVAGVAIAVSGSGGEFIYFQF